MKIRTANELKELNAALNKCTNPVWLMGPNDEAFNMMDEEEYIEGIIKLAEDHDDQLGIFTTSYEDEMTMMNFLEKMADKYRRQRNVPCLSKACWQFNIFG